MGVFRIATANVENLNYPGVRYAGRHGSDGDPVADEVYARKVDWLSAWLDDAKVDVIGLQELFHRSALDDLVAKSARLAGAHVYAPDLAHNVEHGEAHGPFCALVSRFPIVDQAVISAFPADVVGKLRVKRSDDPRDTIDVPIAQFRRPVLRVELELREHTVATVFVAHLKSKHPQLNEGEDPKDPIARALGSARSLMMRAAEAAALRSLVVAAAATGDRPIIVLGDLNDDLGAVTTQIVAGEDPFLDARTVTQPISRRFYSVHDLQERQSRRHVGYTHIHNARYELLDHIFVSEELVEQYPKHIAAVRHTRIYNDHLLDWRLSAERDGRSLAATDHGLPVTEIEWRAPDATDHGLPVAKIA